MAQSRLEKVGTIYSRISSLLKTGAMREENRPLWYEIYEAFPPKYEPRYDRKPSVTKVRPIFYAEDKIRAKFHKDYKHLSNVNLMDNNAISKTEQFIGIYKRIEKEGISQDEVYDKAVETFLTNLKIESTEREKQAKAAAESYKSPIHRPKKNINLQNLLQENAEVVEDVEDKVQYKPIRLSLEKVLEDEKNIENELAKGLEDEVQHEPIRLSLNKVLEDEKDIESELSKGLEDEVQHQPIKLNVGKILQDNEDDPNKAKK